MINDNILVAVLIEDNNTLSLNEVCSKYNIPAELLYDMFDYGLFPNQPKKMLYQQISLNQQELRRIETAFRLHKDLDINLPGIALTLDLLEQIDKMHQELEILRKHF